MSTNFLKISVFTIPLTFSIEIISGCISSINFPKCNNKLHLVSFSLSLFLKECDENGWQGAQPTNTLIELLLYSFFILFDPYCVKSAQMNFDLLFFSNAYL